MSFELINRQQAVETLKGILDEHASRKEYEAIRALRTMPAADRETGYWISGTENGRPTETCSECGFKFELHTWFFYCPKCGAHMVGGQFEI